MRPKLWILLSIILTTGCGSSPSGESLRKVEVLPGDSLPLFLAFDPAGSGVKPVSRYKDIAEKYQFILIGSNNSRNGQGTDQTQQILAALINESVSGSGAGLPSTTTPIRYPADYYGIVGDQDFNYLEMVGLANQFSKQNLRSTLSIFHGIHAWPPPEEFESAIRWHWTNAMNDGMIPKDPLVAEKSAQDYQENLSKLAAIDLTSIDQEIGRQRSYVESMQNKSASWWQKEVGKLILRIAIFPT